MAKEKGEETEVSTDDVTTPEVEDAPTTEQLMETLQTELKAQTTRADTAEKRSQGLQGSLEGKDKQLREQVSSNTRMDGFEQRMEILALAMDKGLSVGDVDGEKLNLKQEFADLTKRQESTRAQETAKLQQEESARVAEGLWTRAQEFGTYDDNDNVAEIYDALVEGKSYKAERIIKKLEKKPEKGGDDKQKWIEEGKRLAAEEKGDLSSDTGGPSGSSNHSYSAEQLDKMSYSEWVKKGKPQVTK